MTSGKTRTAAQVTAETTSGNKRSRDCHPNEDLPRPCSGAIAEYSAQLRLSPLALASRAKYLSLAQSYLAWLAGRDVSGILSMTLPPVTGRCATTVGTSRSSG